MEDPKMWIALIGGPSKGFSAFGPFTAAKDIHRTIEQGLFEPLMRALLEGLLEGEGLHPYWTIELEKPFDPGIIELPEPLPDDAGYDPDGCAVVFGGAIQCGPWVFYGPFRDLEAAQHWCAADDIGVDCALKLLRAPAKAAA
jgi:hypothetical protein